MWKIGFGVEIKRIGRFINQFDLIRDHRRLGLFRQLGHALFVLGIFLLGRRTRFLFPTDFQIRLAKDQTLFDPGLDRPIEAQLIEVVPVHGVEVTEHGVGRTHAITRLDGRRGRKQHRHDAWQNGLDGFVGDGNDVAGPRDDREHALFVGSAVDLVQPVHAVKGIGLISFGAFIAIFDGRDDRIGHGDSS